MVESIREWRGVSKVGRVFGFGSFGFRMNLFLVGYVEFRGIVVCLLFFLELKRG